MILALSTKLASLCPYKGRGKPPIHHKNGCYYQPIKCRQHIKTVRNYPKFLISKDFFCKEYYIKYL